MRFYKVTNDGYIYLIGIGGGGTEITEEEYNEIMSVIRSKPEGTETYDYQLKEDLTWEQYELEPVDPEPSTEEKAEAYDILMGEEE